MKAVWYAKCGEARDVLETGEIDTPEPGSGEVRVRLSTSGINPVDVKRRAGGRGALGAPRVVPHFDGAGVIESVGVGIPDSRVGERVWLYEAQWQRPFGTAAEFVVVPAARAVPLPDGTSYAEGACLGIPALTAHRCVFGEGSVADQTVLVTGGAGAVGNYAIQFAKLGGARVIATVSGDKKAALAADAGADDVINYRNEDVAARVNDITNGCGADLIVEVEFGGNLGVALDALAVNGVIATYASGAEPEPTLPFYSFLYKAVTVRFELVFLVPADAKTKAIADISDWLAADKIRHQVGKGYSFEEVVAAHQAVEQGAQGKVYLQISEDG